VKSGTTGKAFANSEYPDATITSFSSIEKGTDALGAGNIDFFIHDAPTIWRLSANAATQKAGLMGLYRPLTDEHLAWAVRLEDKYLADALNQSLDAIKKNGTLGRIMGKWIPIQVKIRK
jgi:polar amino acid transport system substrate-binding protein